MTTKSITVIIVGDFKTGKTRLARYLEQHLKEIVSSIEVNDADGSPVPSSVNAALKPNLSGTRLVIEVQPTPRSLRLR